MVNEINNNLLKYYIETWGCPLVQKKRIFFNKKTQCLSHF